MKKSLTVKRKMSFLRRIEKIGWNIQTLNGGQKYIDEKDWIQLRHIDDVVRYGSAYHGKPSVHNLVRVGYVEEVKARLMEV